MEVKVVHVEQRGRQRADKGRMQAEERSAVSIEEEGREEADVKWLLNR